MFQVSSFKFQVLLNLEFCFQFYDAFVKAVDFRLHRLDDQLHVLNCDSLGLCRLTRFQLAHLHELNDVAPAEKRGKDSKDNFCYGHTLLFNV